MAAEGRQFPALVDLIILGQQGRCIYARHTRLLNLWYRFEWDDPELGSSWKPVAT